MWNEKCLVSKVVHQSVKIKSGKKSKDSDVFRDTWVRYLGYSNEVGEAFRSLVNVKLVYLSYGLASSYVIADSVHKGYTEYQKKGKVEDRTKRVAIAAGDSLVWQGFASVVIPGFIINRLCTFSGIVLKKGTQLRGPVRHWATTIIGLMFIPFIVKPIDHGVEIGMDKTIRKLYSVSNCDSSSRSLDESNNK